MEFENIAIIGGTGFVGDYLLKLLYRHKNFRLSVIYRNTEPGKKLTGVKYFKIDASENFKKLERIIKKTDLLIILSTPNIQLIKNIVKVSSRVKKIMYSSSILVYKSSKRKQNESSEIHPVSNYEHEKILEEQLLEKFAKSKKVNLIIARLTNVYGDTKNRGIIHKLLSSLISGEEFTLNNKGSQVRDFIFVEDAAKYIELLATQSQKNLVEVFNVCTGRGYSLRHLITKLEKITLKKLKLRENSLVNEKASIIGDNKKIAKLTGYKPIFDLDSGLKKTYLNYLN